MIIASGHVPLDDGESWCQMLNDALSQDRVRGIPVMWLFHGSARVQANAARNHVGPIADGSFSISLSSVACNNVSRGATFVEEVLNNNIWK